MRNRNRNPRRRPPRTATRFPRRPTENAELSAMIEHRLATRKKKAQEDRQPGQTSQTLRRRMGDALADIFDEFGPDIYAETTLALKEVILETFEQGFSALDQTVKEELGKRGVEESRQHIRAWANEIVEDVNHFGLDEVAGSLEDFVGTLAAEFQQPEAGEGDDLLEVDEGEIEEVQEEEVEEVAPVAEEPAEEVEGEELDLEDLGLELPEQEAAARFGPLGGRRQRPAPRRFRRRAHTAPRQGARRGRPFARKAAQVQPPQKLAAEIKRLLDAAQAQWDEVMEMEGLGGGGEFDDVRILVGQEAKRELAAGADIVMTYDGAGYDQLSYQSDMEHMGGSKIRADIINAAAQMGYTTEDLASYAMGFYPDESAQPREFKRETPQWLKDQLHDEFGADF